MVCAENPILRLQELFLHHAKEGIRRGEEVAEVLFWETSPAGNVCDGGLRIYLLQGLRNMPVEGGKNGLHPKFPFPPEYLFLKLYLRVYPALGQGTVLSVYVAHTVPGKVGRPCEPGADLIIRKPVMAEDFLPHGFLSGNCQRQINAAQGHPVYEPLPLRPVPPGEFIAEGTVVEEEAVRHQCPAGDGLRNHRHFPRHFHGV